MRKLLVSALVILLAAYVAGALLFLDRDDDDVAGGADAVVVLAGDESRLPVALRLVRDHVAPVLVVSEDVSGKDETRQAFCREGKVPGVEVVCRTASPFSTRGEARLVASLAERRGWHRIVVVTSRYHLFRAERLFRRCTGAELLMRGTPVSFLDGALGIPFEWGKLALSETLRRGC